MLSLRIMKYCKSQTRYFVFQHSLWVLLVKRCIINNSEESSYKILLWILTLFLSFLVTLNKSWHTLINNSIFSLSSHAVKTRNILIVIFEDRLAKIDSILVGLFLEHKNKLWRNMMLNVHWTFNNSLNQTIYNYIDMLWYR